MTSVFHICPDYNGTKLYSSLIQELEISGVKNKVYVPSFSDSNKKSEYEIVYLNKTFSKFDRLFFYRKQNYIINDINRIIRTNKDSFDIVHAHNLFSAGYAAYQIFKKHRIPYIVAVRGTDVNIFFKYMIHLRKVGISILANAQKIIFISPAYFNFVSSQYFPNNIKDELLNKSIVIPNGIDKYFLDNIPPLKRELLKNTIRIVYVGEIVKNKNLTTTIMCCNELKKLGYNIEYKVVGISKDNKLLKKIVSYSYVKYYGVCSKSNIINIYRESDIFIMPSIKETFGLVYPEAMSQGLPVIYTKNQGFDGFFNDGEVGFAVSPYDLIYIKNKVLEILNDYCSISERCVSYSRLFNWRDISDKYNDIYHHITK